MRFQVPSEHEQLVINGRTYTPDEDGVIVSEIGEDHGLLRQLGCHGEGDAPVAARVEPSEPPPIPEGYVDPEVVRGLIEENEDQKMAIDALNGRLELAQQQFAELTDANTKLSEELSSARSVEDELRRRIQELDGQLAHAATETASGDAQDAGAGASGSDEEKAPETAPAGKKAK